MPDPEADAIPAYDPEALFHEIAPLNPIFITEATRALLRALPIDPEEPAPWSNRRIFSALLALSALHPRDETEVMLSIQALAAYHAAASCWHLGMNLQRPNGDSTRHIAAACSATRVYDSMLRALERRQAKPLAVPVGRPAPQAWPPANMSQFVETWENRGRYGQGESEIREPTKPDITTQEDLAALVENNERERIEKENAGLDIANTEGILPGGGMILPEHPTPQQAAYLGRRLGLMYRREYEQSLRDGKEKIPEIRPIRPGDLIP